MNRRRLLGSAWLVAAAVAAVGPLAGLPIGLATAAVALALGTPYAIAAGHVLLLAAFPEGVNPISLLAVEAGLLGLLATDAASTPTPRRFLASALLAATGLGGLAWILAESLSPWLAAIGLLAAVAIAAYGVHRYGLLATGALATDRPDTTTTEP